MSKKILKGMVAGISASFGLGAVLILSKDQAALRAGSLREVSKGKFEVLAPVVFKRGEKVGIEGPVDRATQMALGLDADALADQKKVAAKTKAEKAALDKAAAEKAKAEAEKDALDKAAADKKNKVGE